MLTIPEAARRWVLFQVHVVADQLRHRDGVVFPFSDEELETFSREDLEVILSGLLEMARVPPGKR